MARLRPGPAQRGQPPIRTALAGAPGSGAPGARFRVRRTWKPARAQPAFRFARPAAVRLGDFPVGDPGRPGFRGFGPRGGAPSGRPARVSTGLASAGTAGPVRSGGAGACPPNRAPTAEMAEMAEVSEMAETAEMAERRI